MKTIKPGIENDLLHPFILKDSSERAMVESADTHSKNLMKEGKTVAASCGGRVKIGTEF